MSQRPLPLLQPGPPLPKGTPAFESRREALIQELNASIPQELYLPQETIDNAPANVTSIPRTSGLLTPRELAITETFDATALAREIAERRFTAVEVAVAFCKRAAVAQQVTCCLTQFFMDEAVGRARELDEFLEKEGRVVGPLHGVPVSVKEHMMLRGHYSSFGFLNSRGEVDERDAPLIETLRNAGAVFYCKTNQPQGIMHLETDSWYGRTLNPHNTALSAGGSTGGEAALIAMRGSILGIGTDIGGSIRGPSAFCGIFGFKPTTYTLATADMGSTHGFPAELNILVSIGPMTRSLRDINMFMELQIAAKHYLHDPRVIPLPWNPVAPPSTEKIRVGIMMNDGNIVPQPPVLQALEWAKEKLSKNSRFELKPYTPYQSAEAMRLLTESYWPDNGLNTKAALEVTGEPMYPLTKAVLGLPFPEPTAEKAATEVSNLRVARDNFRAAFTKHFSAQEIDVVLAPCFVGPASKHDTALYWNYTGLWNYVDYPGVVLPTPVRAETGMHYAKDYLPLSERCKHVKAMWDEGGFDGAPINLQVIGRRYHDGQMMGIVEELQSVLGFEIA